MALYALGDMHLSFSTGKSMDCFGRVWKKHEKNIEKNCRKLIRPEDTFVITGDHSWGIWNHVGEFELTLGNLNSRWGIWNNTIIYRRKQSMRKLTHLLTAGLLAIALVMTGCGSDAKQTGNSSSQESVTEAAPELLTGIYTAEIKIKDHGFIIIEMDADKAPITVTNFVTLAKDGFYDGLTFHRIIDGFMMQGGDPLGNGTGGSGKQIKGEFAANKIENDQSHIRGAVSMARAKAMDSASSQFFIVHADSLFLDGQYACFGYVTEGMEIVDDICANTPVTDNNGSVKAENQPVIESITIK